MDSKEPEIDYITDEGEDEPEAEPTPVEYGKTDLWDTSAFLLTVSPKGDIWPKCVSMIASYLNKNSDFHHCVIEKGAAGKRHLHAIFLCNSIKHKRKLQQNFWGRMVKPYCDPGTVGGIAVKVQVAPGADWYNEYLKKEADVEVVSTCWDADRVDAYFPDADTQELLQAAAGTSNNWAVKLLSDYRAHTTEYTFHTAYVFLFERHAVACRFFQFRTLREQAKILSKFALKDYQPTAECTRWNTQMDGGDSAPTFYSGSTPATAKQLEERAVMASAEKKRRTDATVAIQPELNAKKDAFFIS